MHKYLKPQNLDTPNTWGKKIIFWPHTHQNPNCTLCHKNDRNTWPHLLSLCENPYLTGLRISRHDKAVHLMTQTLQANKNTHFFTLINANKINNKFQDQTIPKWLLKCTCPTNPLPMPCQTQTRHNLHNRSPK
jgi:hypothetical protein